MGASNPVPVGPRASRRGPIALLWGSLLFVGMALGWSIWRAIPPSEDPDSWRQSPWKNTARGVGYVGDGACVRCHSEIAATYARHPMGRSLTPVEPAPAAEGVFPASFEAAGSRFEVERRGEETIHREVRPGPDGRPIAAVEAVARYAIGSGRRGVTYAVEREGRLFESPISWFGQGRRWGISPGYEPDNRHFDRPIEPGCLFCHANRVEPVVGSVNAYEPPVFRGHAIGCERCHGPGGLHVRSPEVVDGRDPAIVNPAHLAPALRLAVCEQCHLLGDQRIERLGRSLFDYRPGLPTSSVVAVFGRRDSSAKVEAVGHVEQIRASRCFRDSGGRLECTSCHDPHRLPDPGERASFYRGRCLACHEPEGCKLPRPDRLARNPDDDCTACHMPRSASSDIAHVATTDHRIPRIAGAPAPAPNPPEDGLPLVLLNGEGLDPKGLAALDRERAMAIAAEGPRLPDSPRTRRAAAFATTVLDRVLAEHPDDHEARRMKAIILGLQGRRAEAIREVGRVLEAVPSHEKALDECLSYAVDAGDLDTLVETACRAVAVDPASPVFRERLAYGLAGRLDWDGAIREARAALAIDPFLRFARMFLVQGLLRRGDRRGAEEAFATLIGLHPELKEPLTRWFADERRAAP